MSGKRIKDKLTNIYVATVLIVATFCMILFNTKKTYALDDEALFSKLDKNMIEVPEDINWKEKGIVEEDEYGREIKYILRNKTVKVYIDDTLAWKSSDKYFVQDMFIEDIDPNVKKREDARNRNKSSKEIVLLLWKEGRYGSHRPFWVLEDEKEYSQHIFTYNIEGDKVSAKWGSSYMGKEAKSMQFKDGILFLTHEAKKTEQNKTGSDYIETAWKWESFGFERVEPVKIFVAGDNLIHDVIYEDAIENHNKDFEYIYKKVEGYTKDSDISVINLETPLMYDEKMYSTYPCFGSPIEVAKGIKDAGFNVVTLSNNHRLDKGVKGIEETLRAVDEKDLMHVGSMDEKPYLLIKRNGIIFALMNYTYGTNGIRPPKGYENAVNYLSDEDSVRDDIRQAKANSDFVIVFPHWGTEYSKEPDAYEKRWRDIFYEEGVDVVVGTHPHVIQEYEMYKPDTDAKQEREMLIYYSLGNYISGNQRPEHNSGGIGMISVSLTSKGARISDYWFREIDSMYKSSKYWH